MKRRTFITMLALGSSGLSARTLGKTSGPTFVVAHGAWSAGWAWKKMHPLLTAAGHRFEDLRAAILIGHGYGGEVATDRARREDWGYFEMDASHSPFITAPEA